MREPGLDHPITIEPVAGTVRVTAAGVVVAETTRALRLSEARYGPVLYIPHEDARPGLLSRSTRKTHCPYKGEASYFDLDTPDGPRQAVAWSYENPFPAVSRIANHLAFYPDKVDAIEETGG